jgi:hypothetical protein
LGTTSVMALKAIQDGLRYSALQVRWGASIRIISETEYLGVEDWMGGWWTGREDWKRSSSCCFVLHMGHEYS